MSRAKLMVKTYVAAAFALLLVGCSSTNDSAPKLSAQGAHPSNWLEVHYAEFIKNPDQCRTCHGSTTDPALAGGIAKVSCFTCHANGPSHQPGWGAGNQHGRMGAQVAASSTGGFASCTKCHGSDYTNGIAISCKTCHTKAPHPDKPWRGAAATLSNHVFSDASNATECIKCHLNGANSSLKPSSPAAAGASPGCFNNTMCHSRNI